MFIEDRLYSAEEVSGGRDIEDREYSLEEIKQMEDLFSEYYEQNIDFYGDDSEKAYNDFYDAYSSGPAPTLVKVEDKKDQNESSKPSFKIGKNTTRGAITGLGAGAGYLVSRVINKKDNAKKKELTLKVNRGQASKSDILELHAINKRIRKTAVAGTLAGGALALGGTALASKLSKKDESEYSDNDQFAEQFADYYSETVDIYGENLEEAYADFVELSQDDEYGIGASLMSGASKAASTVGSGIKKVGSVAGKTLGSTTKSMATGAFVGAGVNAAKGKPILKGAVGGAVVGGAASQLYKRF